MLDADIDRALDQIEAGTDAALCMPTEEEPNGSSGAPPIATPPLRAMDEQLGDAAHTLRMIARRIEAYRRAAAC